MPLDVVRYEGKQLIEIDEGSSEEDEIMPYEDICKQYSPEQQAMVKYLEPIWASFLTTFHMPLFFKLLFFPLVFIYFKFLNKSKGKQWASRITDPIYVSLPLIRTVWNLSGLFIYVAFVRKNLPISTCRRFNVKTEWVLNSTSKPKNLPDSVLCYLYAQDTIPKNAVDQIEYPAVILHIHGGGFIACSPPGHEIYLRRWAKQTGLPIVSINYSKAPEYPFPTAFNQCASVYKFLLSDEGKKSLGIQYEKIIITGDSAGGNMATSITLWTITEGIQRPDAAVLTYPSLNRTPTFTTPSLKEKTNDAIIPSSFRRCYTSSYIASIWDKERKQFSFSDDSTKEYYLTPLSAPDEILKDFPPCYMLCGMCDPLWCDTVLFYNKLSKISENPVVCDAIPGVTHGFLAVGNHMPSTSKFAIESTGDWMIEFSHGNSFRKKFAPRL